MIARHHVSFRFRMHNNATDDRLGSHTPKSLVSLSPASPAGSQSPFDPTSKDTAEFCEFFYNSDRILEKDFAELTLTGWLLDILRIEHRSVTSRKLYFLNIKILALNSEKLCEIAISD